MQLTHSEIKKDKNNMNVDLKNTNKKAWGHRSKASNSHIGLWTCDTAVSIVLTLDPNSGTPKMKKTKIMSAGMIIPQNHSNQSTNQ